MKHSLYLYVYLSLYFIDYIFTEDSQDVTNPNWIVQSANLFEGDIAGVNKSTREMRNAIIGLNFRWPNAVIPYLISSSFSIIALTLRLIYLRHW